MIEDQLSDADYFVRCAADVENVLESFNLSDEPVWRELHDTSTRGRVRIIQSFDRSIQATIAGPVR